MAGCEKCWRDSGMTYAMGQGRGASHVEVYMELIRDREPCTPEQQAGDWWDAERQVDTRFDR